MATEDGGEQLVEGGDDNVRETETGEEAVVLLLQEIRAVLDGGHDDHVEDGAEDAETEVNSDEYSSSCDVIHD